MSRGLGDVYKRQAEDAVMLDSSELNIDEVVEAIYEYAKKAGLEA